MAWQLFSKFTLFTSAASCKNDVSCIEVPESQIRYSPHVWNSATVQFILQFELTRQLILDWERGYILHGKPNVCDLSPACSLISLQATWSCMKFRMWHPHTQIMVCCFVVRLKKHIISYHLWKYMLQSTHLYMLKILCNIQFLQARAGFDVRWHLFCSGHWAPPGQNLSAHLPQFLWCSGRRYMLCHLHELVLLHVK